MSLILFILTFSRCLTVSKCRHASLSKSLYLPFVSANRKNSCIDVKPFQIPHLQYSTELQFNVTEEELALAKLEYESLKLNGETELPSALNDEEWNHLAMKRSVASKRKYLRFLFLNELRRSNHKKKQEARRAHADEVRQHRIQQKEAEEKGTGHLVYGLWNNCIFIKFNDVYMNRIRNTKVMLAMTRGQQIVFDCGYGSSMMHAEQVRASQQFCTAFNVNRMNCDPFYIHLCNFLREDNSSSLLLRSLPTLCNDNFPASVHESSYLDMFPKDKLVYLTPHCRNEMVEYDHDAVYIIGYLVDLKEAEPLSLAKAKKENLKMQKLPLDK